MNSDAFFHFKHHRQDDKIGGLCAVCSSHPMVLAAAMDLAQRQQHLLLVEATPNQVNLSGGYSGMTPAAFMSTIKKMAHEYQVPKDQLVVGADHLGPHLWKSEPAALAMQRCDELVRACVKAGFDKIHLDTNVCCADDLGTGLAPEIVAARASDLCRTAEAAVRESGSRVGPVYVIGNEVPPPGGSLDDSRGIEVTDPSDLASVLHLYHDHFVNAGLEAAWQRVIAVVVQPGIEFGDRTIAVYQGSRAGLLSARHTQLPANMSYEVHAADYQPVEALRRMIEDHFAIFKIGPCLTHALRKTLFALADMESAWTAVHSKSNLRQVMEKVMLQHPEHWRSHYHGSQKELRQLREHSLRDRIRYYWNAPDAIQAVDLLLRNLSRELPVELVQKHIPGALVDLDASRACTNARNLIHHCLIQALHPYFDACQAVF